ncbi:hypothetical protein ACFW0H_15725 [Pseudomonas sp. CR3202]|uniref:lipopolysaccharide core heptose(II)-phosphate phosphatase PmrG n=1 Tax=Pseudomonas sp. CR3202 TaxID=3351532 RepID=UPI003BEF4F69
MDSATSAILSECQWRGPAGLPDHPCQPSHFCNVFITFFSGRTAHHRSTCLSNGVEKHGAEIGGEKPGAVWVRSACFVAASVGCGMIRLSVHSLWDGCRSLLSLALLKKRELFLLVVSIYTTAVAAQGFLYERKIPDLARADQDKRGELLRHWQQGDLVVLVRHVERCDHSEAPCLDVEDGITSRAVAVAAELGGDFKALGLELTDVYTSPVTRAMQTSAYMFNSKVPQQDWLSNCKEAFHDEIVRHKKPHRNLVLVTHSECMNNLQDSLALPAYRTPHYGESLFLTLADSTTNLKVMGSLRAPDWTAFSSIPEPVRLP